MSLRRCLAHPLTRDLPLDAPLTTALRRRVIASKPFLKRLYADWYRRIADSLPAGAGAVLELGSGAGFLRDFVPGLVTSDVLRCPDASVVLDARRIPVRDAALRAIAMVDVLHHVPDCRAFFAEATRCVRPGGAIVAIEPWVTSWSRFVYGRLHHEPFLPRAETWSFPESGPLSGANQALPWIVLQRDRATFEADFPQWRIERVELLMPIRYLVSGGVGMRALAPGWSYGLVRGLERALAGWNDHLAMFAHLVVRRV